MLGEVMAYWPSGFLCLAGVLLGQWLEARRWRAKGDHEYMNRMESGGRLYQVKHDNPEA